MTVNKLAASLYKNNDLYSIANKLDTIRKNGSKDIASLMKDPDIGTSESEKSLAKAARNLKNTISSVNQKRGTSGSDYVSSAKDFAEAYNSTISALGKSDSIDALREGTRMTQSLKVYSGILDRVGIKINKDNTLTVDEDKVKNAQAYDLRTVFNSNNAVISKLVPKTERMATAATKKAVTTAMKESQYNMMYGNDKNKAKSFNIFDIFA